MTSPTDSEIVFAHICSNPEAFLDALNDSPPETKKAVLDHLQALPEIDSDKPDKANSTDEKNTNQNV
jgi:hypothetical protein